MTNDEFTIFVEKYERLVFSICHQLVRDYGEAQNLTQDTFFSAYRSIDNCRPESYKPWLARIATNKARDYLKSAYMRRTVIGDEKLFEALEAGEPPDEIYVASETEQNIHTKIEALEEPYKKVSVLYFMDEKNVNEISDILKRPKKTVQTQLYRAKFLLQKMLGEENST